MGYHTVFTGDLKFNCDLSARELKHLCSFFGEDVRDHDDWDVEQFFGGKSEHGFWKDDFTYIDVVLNDEWDGVKWDDNTEKTYGMVGIINFLIYEMRKIKPEFGFTGELMAQGEDVRDRWKLAMGKNGSMAYRVDLAPSGKIVGCPHCGYEFELEGEEGEED